jgi:hypothetical protein
MRLFIVFLSLSMLFLGLTLFTGRRSAETLYSELFQTYKVINGPNPADVDEGNSPSSSQGRQS